MTTSLAIKKMPLAAEKPWNNPPVPDGRKVGLQLAPVSEILQLRNRLGNLGSLLVKNGLPEGDANLLADDPVMKKMPDYKFSNYSMEPSAIHFLKNIIEQFKPTNILELGSGLSTAILSTHMNKVHKKSKIKPRYVSIDQSQDYLDETQAMLKKVGADEFVELVQMDVCPFDVQGKTDYSCYEFDEDKLFNAFSGTKPDMVIIDGPVGGGPQGIAYARLLTLPLAKLFTAPGAIIFLDDSLRDTELEIIAQWSKLSDVKIHGIKCLAKGIMVGQTA